MAKLQPMQIVVPASGPYHVDVRGKNLFVVTTTGNVNLILRDTTGETVVDTAIGPATPGFGGGMTFKPKNGFVSMDWYSGTGGAVTVFFFVTDDEVTYNQLAGTVNTVNQKSGRALAFAGNAFGCKITQVANAGFAAFVKLAMPAAATVSAVLKRASVWSGVAAGTQYAFYSTAALADLTNVFTPVNKNLSSATAAQLHVSMDIVAQPAAVGIFGYKAASTSFTEAIWDGYDKEIVIAPGTALIIASGNVNQNMLGMLDWDEGTS